ncbi:MAG: hypothetical protein ACD_62C00360G0001 [uncultured bacterium]|nr:MAG: hypothetical protein ACD_62C00360G0001 [uncultured bacterium]
MHEVKIKCACGNEIHTYSTVKDVHSSICSGCHPFYTGKQKILDIAGRVEKFKRKYEQKSEPQKKAPRTVTIND